MACSLGHACQLEQLLAHRRVVDLRAEARRTIGPPTKLGGHHVPTSDKNLNIIGIVDPGKDKPGPLSRMKLVTRWLHSRLQSPLVSQARLGHQRCYLRASILRCVEEPTLGRGTTPDIAIREIDLPEGLGTGHCVGRTCFPELGYQVQMLLVRDPGKLRCFPDELVTLMPRYPKQAISSRPTAAISRAGHSGKAHAIPGRPTP